MKHLVKVLALFFLISCNATSEEVKELNKKREGIISEISQQRTVSQGIAQEIQGLEEKKANLEQKVKLLEAEAGGQKVVYILALEVSIRKNLNLNTYDADLEIPVSKDFYESATVGQALENVSGSRSLSLLSLDIHNASCTIKSKRTVIQ